MRLIDVEQLDFLMFEGKSKDFVEGVSWILEQIDKADPINAIPIPDNATNGDMIKAMFPKMCAKSTNSDYYFDDDADNHSYMHIDLGWWNAPYKAESEG